MEITVFDRDWRITVMPKKAMNTSESSATPSPLAKKPAALRTRKHVKAQAVAVAAAFEEFVSAIVHPAPAQPAAAETKPAAKQPTPTHEDVSRLAYKLYLERGGLNGSPAEDWLRAEQTLLG
jgi:hypothetical protein